MKPVFWAISAILLVGGAVISYGARKLLETFYKQPFDEKEVGILKSIGLFTVLAGAVPVEVLAADYGLDYEIADGTIM